MKTYPPYLPTSIVASPIPPAPERTVQVMIDEVLEAYEQVVVGPQVGHDAAVVVACVGRPLLPRIRDRESMEMLRAELRSLHATGVSSKPGRWGEG